ncbi:hypothetical protein K437DRAFT_221603 [Tilletiaria anomala UBC 951]|uniref:Glutathione S-transferase omega-like 2 n=1 Tax=Tilletiaria anomala (strain ATCC 24038 / CBS 436.72 / UBC 951) TaxID=1037660 RepID=A0A066WFV2_TILAU|nr:uncharacterized protein K437DRAFT_221603 [Tilletiaria anomala UBC 951]KDN51383.1 hypothetical protein K437DRAFT_221603 [Tilletiaria anomala UBC 951]
MASTDTKKNDVLVWASKDGHYRRQVSSFRDSISIAPDSQFQPELNRYKLIVSYACPWAHRTLIVRALKGMDKVEGLLPYTSVNSFLGSNGWTFTSDEGPEGLGILGEGFVPGHKDKKLIRDFYREADPGYNAKCTVPIIWDEKNKTIVSNESSEIIRFMNTCFDQFLPEDKKGLSFYPEDDKLRKEIDELNEWVYDTINNGVYKCGFASKQEAYEANIKPLFKSLDRIESILSDGRDYLIGNKLTEADIRLYTTIIRFDPVYVGHFKCNLNTIRAGYPEIHRWLRQLYWSVPGFKETTRFDHIKAHYYQSHSQINPTRIVPSGPAPDILPLEAQDSARKRQKTDS